MSSMEHEWSGSSGPTAGVAPDLGTWLGTGSPGRTARPARVAGFAPRPGAVVLVRLELEDGTVAVADLVGCSLGALRAWLPSFSARPHRVDELVPRAGIAAGGREYPLGRLLTRRIDARGDGSRLVGFATVDGGVPVGGGLSAHLQSVGRPFP